MREIEFRGKALDGGKWVTGWYVEACFGSWPLEPAIIPSEDAKRGYYGPVAVDPSTVGQRVGRFFEGDIIDYMGALFLIEYSEKERAFIGRSLTRNSFVPLAKHIMELSDVVGNKWDNPELLK